ncbi:MAG TPA: hypothetical protein VFA11_13905 [Acidimicrobiales bacterium]|nr:hypothetical protein [Acidimicrobiales bacterium]
MAVRLDEDRRRAAVGALAALLAPYVEEPAGARRHAGHPRRPARRHRDDETPGAETDPPRQEE